MMRNAAGLPGGLQELRVIGRNRNMKATSIRQAASLALLAGLGLAGGCSGTQGAAGGGESVASKGLVLPASATPSPALAPLGFMTGRWIGVNPNKSVNEEHWTSPMGNAMLALFRQVRRDGKPALVEISMITADADGVTLKLRHLHGGLEVPANRAELSVFKLKSAANNRAEFVGTGKAEQVTSVVYRLVGPDELAVDVSFAPDSKEKGFTSNYTREGKLSFAPPELPKAAEAKPAKPAGAAAPAAEAPKPAVK